MAIWGTAGMMINYPTRQAERVLVPSARGVLCSITGSDYTTLEVNDAAQVIRQAADPDAHIIFGATFDAALADRLQVTLIATGFSDHPDEAGMPGHRSGEPPWSGGPPPSAQRIPRRPSPGTRSATAEAAQPDIDLPSTGAMGAIGIPGLPVDRPGDGEIGQA